MESSSTPNLPIPRLRISRQSPKHDDDIDTPQAGPSRLHRTMDMGAYLDNNDEGEDAQSTPRLPTKSITPPEPSSMYSATPTETPAARLRALLSRVPNSPSTPKMSNHAPPGSSSDLDSDFDPPRSSPINTPSIARESLKDLFSRALREPGDTPQKKRMRRNSIDVSEVEASPRVERERAKHKGKRRSLSDEEADKPSRSETSLRSSQAATFDTLRERLTNSQTQLMNQHAPFDDQYESGLSDTPADPSGNESFLRQLETSPGTPPAATSTPHRSVQLPSQLQFQSNLLDQDSDMHDAMKDFDSFEGDSAGPSKRPLSFPPSRTPKTPHSAPARPLSHASGSKAHSYSRVQGVRYGSLSRHNSADLTDGASSRASSSQSHADFKEFEHEREVERNREREREWNKPHALPKTPELHHRHSHSHGSNSSGGRSGSPMLNVTNGLNRRGSVTSLRSFDDGRSSRTSSFGSQAEYRERINELEKERNIERERDWNKRHSTPTSRPNSSLSMHSHSPIQHSRIRTQSHPTRPDSATSRLTPELHRHKSFDTSRASSPSSSVRSRDSEQEIEEEVKHVVEHQRERNWNSPHPKWDPNAPHLHGRSVSPLPPSLSPRPSFSHSHSHSLSHSHSQNLRSQSPRVESPTQYLRTGLRPSSSHSSLNGQSKSSPPAPSPWPHPVKGKQPTSIHQTPPSIPATESDSKENGSPSKIPTPGSRFGWQFPRNKTALPPLEFDQHSPERQVHQTHSRIPSSPTPGSRPINRVSGPVKPSHIPVRSPNVSSRTIGGSGLRKGHRRSMTELGESVGGIPPQVISESLAIPEDNTHQDSLLASDEELPSPMPASTPTMRPVSMPESDAATTPPGSPPPRHSGNQDETRLQKALSPIGSEASTPTSTPPSSPSVPKPNLSLATPPRRRSFNSSKIEFQTPSPPKGMPELPGPPSSSSEEGDDDKDWTPARLDTGAHLDYSSMKTPKPPGAWNSTPLPPHRSPLIRSHSLPDTDDVEGETTPESGLATPIASLSRANSLPMQTPAPPGAWLATPGSERRRSILKVRFDVESEQSTSEALANGNGHTVEIHVPQDESSGEVFVQNIRPITPPQNIELPASVEIDDKVVTPVTPRSTPPSSLRRSPSIRILDAFGREQKDEAAETTVHEFIPPPEVNTPRSKSTIRIVDAMGREVGEVVETTTREGKSEQHIPLGHNEALRLVRQSIADLASGLNEVDSSGNELDFDDKRLSELNDVSRAARDARNKLAQTLRMARNTENDLRSKYGSMRASMKRSKLLPAIFTESRLPWSHNNALIFWGVVTIQILLILLMYRISTARAKDVFLSTYYDPYYPELHLYITKPDTFRLSLAHTSRWSIFSIPETFQRNGLKAVVAEAWNGVAMSVWDWQRHIWDTWGTSDPVHWPPT